MNTITLAQVNLDKDYSKKWNETCNDFVIIYKNGERVSDTLYRTGMGGGKVEDNYFLMLKHSEIFYKDTITTNRENKRHLKSQWCIINNDGEEVVVFDQFTSPYLLGGVIYTVDNSYYNIETKEMYCKYSSNVMDSGKYIFIDNKLDNNKDKRGVMQITKKDGSVILHQ